jgi:hypothetical protein
MRPLSPILDDFRRDPANYRILVNHEQVLCTVILTLSTRYHILKVDGWLSRSYFIHNRLWRYCQSLLQRVIWGQERGTPKMARGLGAIEGLLLMAEWHARSLHLPPDIEAWESDSDTPEPIDRRPRSSKSKPFPTVTRMHSMHCRLIICSSSSSMAGRGCGTDAEIRSHVLVNTHATIIIR